MTATIRISFAFNVAALLLFLLLLLLQALLELFVRRSKRVYLERD